MIQNVKKHEKKIAGKIAGFPAGPSGGPNLTIFEGRQYQIKVPYLIPDTSCGPDHPLLEG